jgi:hypothetical protein
MMRINWPAAGGCDEIAFALSKIRAIAIAATTLMSAFTLVGACLSAWAPGVSYPCPTPATHPLLHGPTGAAPAEPPKQPNGKPQNDIRRCIKTPILCICWA